MIRRIGYGVLASLVLSGCGGGGGSDSPATEPANEPDTTNTAPMAEAGPDQNLKVGDTVWLDGSGSHDADGNPLTYHWTLTRLPPSSTTALSRNDTAKPHFLADTAGRYVATLVVNDGEASSTPASVEIVASVRNSAPTANAGADQNVATGNEVHLDGRDSSDANGNLLVYRWYFTSKPGTSNAQLQNEHRVQPSFTPDVDGEYRIALVVSDGLVDSDMDEIVITATTANNAPIANAGTGQNVIAGDTVTLDGSASHDVDGDAIAYHWRFVSRPAGSNATLTDSETARPGFVADAPGDYVIELAVNDGHTDSAPDNVAVTAAKANARPVANAGADQTVLAGDTVTLDGSASHDSDGDRLTYQWHLVSRPAGSLAALASPNTVAPTFQADLPGSYVISLVVNDGDINSEPATIMVTANERNAAPVAQPGHHQDVETGQTVRLDGAASTDANGDALSYRWRFVSRPTNSAAALSDAASVTPNFVADKTGTFVLELIVSDGQLDSAPATVTITATRANLPPSADAGPAQSVTEGDLVTLDGSASSDPDGDTITYSWHFVSTPAGSSAALSDSTVVAPTFTADTPGHYVLALTVNDGKTGSTEDSVTITAAERNAAPVADAGRDQNVMTGVVVLLNGSASADANGDPLTYQWRFVSTPTGSLTALIDDATDAPSFTPDIDGTYVLELIVNDGVLNSTGDRVQITATTANSAPVADAGPDGTVYVNNRADLDGSRSHDADGDSLTYAWSLNSLPTGSTAALQDGTTAHPSFTPDQAGDYIFKLVVSDGEKTSTEDSVRVTALLPDLSMEEYDDVFSNPPAWRNSGLPYGSNSSQSISRVCSGGCGPITLARFRLTAEGRSYTIQNVHVANAGGTPLPAGLNPRFSGLGDGDVIRPGETLPFSLLVENVRSTVEIEFVFEVAETGDTFRSHYTLSIR